MTNFSPSLRSVTEGPETRSSLDATFTSERPLSAPVTLNRPSDIAVSAVFSMTLQPTPRPLTFRIRFDANGHPIASPQPTRPPSPLRLSITVPNESEQKNPSMDTRISKIISAEYERKYSFFPRRPLPTPSPQQLLRSPSPLKTSEMIPEENEKENTL